MLPAAVCHLAHERARTPHATTTCYQSLFGPLQPNGATQKWLARTVAKQRPRLAAPRRMWCLRAGVATAGHSAMCELLTNMQLPTWRLWSVQRFQDQTGNEHPGWSRQCKRLSNTWRKISTGNCRGVSAGTANEDGNIWYGNFCVFPLGRGGGGGGGGGASAGTSNEDANAWCGKFEVPLGGGGGASVGTSNEDANAWCGKFEVSLGGGGGASAGTSTADANAWCGKFEVPLGGGGGASAGTGNEDANAWCGKFGVFRLGGGGGGGAPVGTGNGDGSTWCGKFGVPLGGGGNTSVGTGNEDANSWCGKFGIFPLGVGGGASAGTDTWCGKFGVALGGGGNASVSQALRCQHLMHIWSLPTWRWWWSTGRHGQWRWHNLRMRVGSSSVGGASAKGVNESVVVWSSIKLCNPASRSTSLAVSTESEHFRSHQLRHVRIRRCCQHRWA